MSSVGAFAPRTSYKWCKSFVKDDFDMFVADRRGGKRGDCFWDQYPNIREEAYGFAAQACGRKAASFSAEELSRFINDYYCEITKCSKQNSGYVRCVEIMKHKEALNKYPELEDNNGINYEKNSATVSIAIGIKGYFTNEVILSQFTRICKLLPHKTEYKGHKFVILVDNATTHTAKFYSVNDFGKRENTRCPVDVVEWEDKDGKLHEIDCYYPPNVKNGCSKGLLVLARELRFKVDEKIKLDRLKELLSTQSAFQKVVVSISCVFTTKLERLTNSFGVFVLAKIPL
ncbi:unnamed protein product [Didymodactylos carnosus]|nr:unnamed protein product [Didymodactylos carnosus]CAF3956819.1 unnamed protein product [Didymodactylos carnosus]